MEEALRTKLLATAALATLVGTRIDWNIRSQGAALPAVVLRTISDIPDMTYAGATGWNETRVQIDAWARTHKAARDTRSAAIAPLVGFRGTLSGIPFRIFVIDGDGGPDTDSVGPVHRARADLHIWYRQ